MCTSVAKFTSHQLSYGPLMAKTFRCQLSISGIARKSLRSGFVGVDPFLRLQLDHSVFMC